jgi:hypothetical protein
MGSRRRILSFAWDDRLLALLARQGDDWDVVPQTAPDREAPWRLFRRLPENAAVVSLPHAHARLRRGEYDLVVCFGLHDLADLEPAGTPILLVMTGTPELARVLGITKPLKAALGTVTSVFLSEVSRRAWGCGGEVVPLGLDLNHYGPYSGNRAEVLVVAHLGTLLPETINRPVLQRATSGLRVTGVDSAIRDTPDQTPGGRPWILDAYARHRTLLDTTPPWCRDGQHLSVLEAMATGQPVVTVPKPLSPVVTGLSGFVEDDPTRLHQRLLELLSDQDLAVRLGANARRTVMARFPAAPFRERWRDLVDVTARPVAA